MAQQSQDPKQRPADSTGACMKVEDLLTVVSDELAAFEAKKLADLKAELDAIAKKKGAAVEDYRKKYKELRDRWCAQQQLVERLESALKCAFPGQDWKKIVAECICERKWEIKCAEEALRKRSKCCRGKRERKRDDLRDRLELVRTRLNVLMALTQKVEAQLGDDDKLIEEIKKLLSGPDQAVALYLFFFKLLPQHVGLRPGDISEECKKYGDDLTPEKLCEEVLCKACPPDDSSCVEKSPADEPEEGTKPPERHPVPWLIGPDKLAGEIDCAAQDYRQSKNDAAEAEAAFKKDPDDLDALKKALDDLKAKFEDKVKTCLKAKKPDDKCCTTTPADTCKE
jgi:hypothetical protein